jgi:transposase-like protein
MARRTIDPAVKAAVLEALQDQEVNKVELAKQHGLSLPTLYNWLKKAKVVEATPEAY